MGKLFSKILSRDILGIVWNLLYHYNHGILRMKNYVNPSSEASLSDVVFYHANEC